MRENKPVGGNPGRRESDKQDISRRVSSAYMPSESHKRKVENFRLNITDELPIGGEKPRSVQPAGGGKPPQEPRPSTTKMTKAQKKAYKKRNRQKSRKNRWLYRSIWLAMVVLVSVGIAQYAISGATDMLAIKRKENPSTVVISLSKDATTDEITDILLENGLIANWDFFQLYSRITKADDHYGYGDFELSTDLDYEALINKLQISNNRAETVEVMFPEGSTVREIAQMLENKGVCTTEELFQAVNQFSEFEGYEWIGKIKNASERYYLLEGYLFPDTYQFYKSEDPTVVLGKMLNNGQKKITEEIQEQAEDMGMTIDEVMTLASMIQAEAADVNDMYMISSVFHNRLEAGSASAVAYLGSDPTVWYPYANRAEVPADQVDTFESRYNTYKIKGLPPGPICNPGEDAIQAALNPKDTNYLYFCHAKDGTAYYATNASQHEANLKKAGLA